MGELASGHSRGCFLATIHAGETMRQLRRGVRELGRHAALPVWVAEHEAIGSAETGLPMLRSWTAVYLTVAGIFVLWSTLLIVFMRAYS